jgi:hypothetical protein
MDGVEGPPSLGSQTKLGLEGRDDEMTISYPS